MKVIATYHPASIFHDEEKMEAIREDFRRVKEAMVSGLYKPWLRWYNSAN